MANFDLIGVGSPIMGSNMGTEKAESDGRVTEDYLWGREPIVSAQAQSERRSSRIP